MENTDPNNQTTHEDTDAVKERLKALKQRAAQQVSRTIRVSIVNFPSASPMIFIEVNEDFFALG